MELPRGYISYSQIRLYQLCPKKYYYTYIEDRKAPINDKIFLGVVFHSVVEHYLNEQINGRTLEKEELVEYFKEQFENLQADEKITWDATENETRRRGKAFVHHFLRDIAQELQPLMVEKEMEAHLPELDVTLKGVIDLVETDFSITDFKTTTAKWSKTRVKESYLQMQIYRYLFEKNFGDVVTHLRFRIVYSKSAKAIKDQKISVQATDLDSSRMFDIIKYVVENIRNEVFYKNESYHCGFCDFKDICRTST